MASEVADQEPDGEALFAPGTFGCHEAMHMTHVLADMVDWRLCEHPAVKRNQSWSALAGRASDALHNLYREIGKAHMTGRVKQEPAWPYEHGAQVLQGGEDVRTTKHTVALYDEDGSEILRTCPLTSEQVERVRQVVRPNADDPAMIGCYEVGCSVFVEAHRD